MIARYQLIRPAQGYQSLICKVIDFQVFTAAMILVLNLFDSSVSNSKRNQEEDDRDWDLLMSTNEILQHASKATGKQLERISPYPHVPSIQIHKIREC